MAKKLVYLAGGIGGMSYKEANSWREQAIYLLGRAEIECLSPMRGKEHLAGLDEIPSLRGQDRVAWIEPANYIIHRGLSDLKRCDAVLAELTLPDNPYRGTICELVYARLWHKPVVVWSSWAQDSPWIAYHASAVLPTLEECCQAIIDLIA